MPKNRPPIIAFAGNRSSGKDTAADELAQYGYLRVAQADAIKRLVRPVFGFSNAQLFGPSAQREVPHVLDDDAWLRIFDNLGVFRDAVEGLFPRDVDAWVAFEGFVLQMYRDRAILTARHALQQCGTEFGRTTYLRVWIDETLLTLRLIARGWSYTPEKGLAAGTAVAPAGFIITDVRFADEAAVYRECGGRVFWLDAAARLASRAGEAAMKHASEPKGSDVFGSTLAGTIDNNGTEAEFRARIRALL